MFYRLWLLLGFAILIYQLITGISGQTVFIAFALGLSLDDLLGDQRIPNFFRRKFFNRRRSTRKSF